MKILPTTPEELLQYTWAQFEPAVKELAERELDEGRVDQWLLDWSHLLACIYELFSRRYLATTVDTADAVAKARFDDFIDNIYPHSLQADQGLKEKLLASGLQPKGFAVALRNMRSEADLFRPANLPLLSEEQKLAQQYDVIVGAQTVQWQGEELTITQLRPLLMEADRARREQAWRLRMQRQLADRAAIAEVWAKLYALRQQLAANAGRPDYRTFRWQQLLRFDYTPADSASFRQAIEQAVVPAARRLYELRRQQLGVETLRPWDLDVDPLGRSPLRPFTHVAELIARGQAIFHQVDPVLGEYFDIEVREGLLDLENRKNKAPGAYCTSFDLVRRPFIFANAVGLHDDVQTLLHEAGHSFHVFEVAPIRYHHLTNVPMEFAEVASMGMELLASPYLEAAKGGFYTPDEAARARAEHLTANILFWPYMAVVDGFQDWAYENPAIATDPAACDAAWGELWERFMPGVDWSGLEEYKLAGWQRKEHLYSSPFYYIEYGLAQLGAVQVWRNSLTDQAGAVRAYRHALSLGGSVTLPELFQAAGARLSFDAATLGEMVALMESKL